MANLIDVKVPDIGDFRDVPIIEVLVQPGDRVKTEQSLITLESDKASMEVPSPVDGVVKEIKVKVGDKVSEGSLILIAEAEAAPAGVAPREKIKGGGTATGEGAPVADYGAASGVYEVIEVRVPDIGDFKDVPIIEIAVKGGDKVKPEDPLITLESDKASMEVPSPTAGTVKDVRVKIGDKVSEGSLILTLETGVTGRRSGRACRSTRRRAPAARRWRPAIPVTADHECDMLVLGAGPGGYSAAFRSADLGMTTVLVERYPTLGGVCLNVGCIPSKALLHTASVMDEVKAMAAHGISYSAPQIDLAKLRTHKEKVVGKLTGGLAGMAKARKVTVLEGVGKFLDPHHLEVAAKERRRPQGGQVRQGRSSRPVRRRSSCRSFRTIRAWWIRPARSSCGKSEIDAGDRRRYHRARNGDCLFDARHSHRRGRDARRTDDRSRPRSG